MGSGSLNPTWNGHVASTRDALVLFESCLKGDLRHVPRRPHDRERSQLIKSGSVFIYEENASGIKRWTDGVPWSPSRILGNFLVYRELLKPFPPGEKKRATKRNKRATKPGEPYPRADTETAVPSSPTTPGARSENGSAEGKEAERALIGSLIDSYGFKPDGLVKKTMSVNVHGVHHHLVSYYKIDDVIGGKLMTVAQDQMINMIDPRSELTLRQNFRSPLDDENGDSQENQDDSQHMYYQPQQYHDPRQFLGHAPHAHHPHHIDAPVYSSAPYNSSVQVPPHMYGSYSQAPQQQPFYPANQQAAHQPMNAYSQASYAPQYANHPQSHGLAMTVKTERSPSYQQPQTQNYRHNSAAGTENRPMELASTNGIHEQASRDGSAWSRGGGPYASTSTQSPVTAAPVFSYTNGPPMNGQHVSMPPPTQSQPILRNVHAPWPPAADVWQMQNHNLASHQQSYPTQHS
ncbi:hypothetical protein MMC11_003612 [Xylographa trunciseda]|nr:hypothetical protein [Xylographa trunciseda]